MAQADRLSIAEGARARRRRDWAGLRGVELAGRGAMASARGRRSGLTRRLWRCGGNAWESNPPDSAERRLTDFEDRETHRGPTAPDGMVRGVLVAADNVGRPSSSAVPSSAHDEPV